MITRTCKICELEQSIDNFSHSDKKRGYRRHRCKTCQNKFNLANPKNSRITRAARLKRLFGISLEQYEEMLKRQNGKCAICQETCKTHNNLCVDHDHETGKIRSLLCMNCNTALGHFKDDPKLLKKALEYIKSWQT